MSTRAVIARWTDQSKQEWTGTYHHWDGYPVGLGRSLYKLIKKRTLGDLPATLDTLIDKHSAGWSTINGVDWARRIGFRDMNCERCTICNHQIWKHFRQYYDTPYNRRKLMPPSGKAVLIYDHVPTHDDDKPGPPECYCHGMRREKRLAMTHRNAAACGAEWAYVFDSTRHTMTVLEAHIDGRHSTGMFGVGDPDAGWIERAVVFLDNPEPEWETMQG